MRCTTLYEENPFVEKFGMYVNVTQAQHLERNSKPCTTCIYRDAIQYTICYTKVKRTLLKQKHVRYRAKTLVPGQFTLFYYATKAKHLQANSNPRILASSTYHSNRTHSSENKIPELQIYLSGLSPYVCKYSLGK